MGRYRSRSRSYSPFPRRYSRSPPPPFRPKRYDDPRDRYRGGGPRDRRPSAPSGLLVRNISLDARPEDLRIPFERFGPIKDVYLPKNYYTGEPRGFGFVKFRNPEDAYEAKQQMNHQVICGREITIVFAEENRKTPKEMGTTARISGSTGRYMGGGHGRRSPMRSPRAYSRSPPRRHDSRDRDKDARDGYPSLGSASPPPRPRRRSPSPVENGRSLSRSRSYSPRR